MQDDLHRNRELISELYLKNYDYLVDLARYLGQSRDVAEDLVQETFEIVLKQQEQLQTINNKRAWLVGILKNRIRLKNRNVQYAQQLQRHLEQLYEEGRRDEVNLTILYCGCIGEDELRLLIRYYADDWPVSRLAAEMDIKPAACHQRIQRAKKQLRKYIEENGIADTFTK